MTMPPAVTTSGAGLNQCQFVTSTLPFASWGRSDDGTMSNRW